MRLRELQALMMQYIKAGGAPPKALLAELKAPPEFLKDRLAIYRELSRGTQIRALEAFYPVLKTLVGESLFGALANDFLDTWGSKSGNLHDLGEGFNTLLEREAACHDYPYLSEVAEFEWLLHQVSMTPDLKTRDGRSEGFGVNEGMDLSSVRGVWASGLTLRSFDWPVHHIWQAHQSMATEAIDRVELDQKKYWLALFRGDHGLTALELAESEHTLLMSGLLGEPIATLFEAAPHQLIPTLQRWRESQLLLGFQV